MSQDVADDKWTLVQMMAKCCQATIHYLNYRWLGFMVWYDVTRHHWIKNTNLYIIHIQTIFFISLPKREGWGVAYIGCLTHWGRVTHICVSKFSILGSDNGLSPGWRQAIIWTNAGILLIGPLGTNFNGILSKIQTFSFKKMRFKTSSAK